VGFSILPGGATARRAWIGIGRGDLREGGPTGADDVLYVGAELT
jgi:hypothetical protein